MAQETTGDSIFVEKKTFAHMLDEFEHLLKDFEKISEQNFNIELERRLSEVKEKKIKGITEKEFLAKLRREGVNV